MTICLIINTTIHRSSNVHRSVEVVYALVTFWSFEVELVIHDEEGISVTLTLCFLWIIDIVVVHTIRCFTCTVCEDDGTCRVRNPHDNAEDKQPEEETEEENKPVEHLLSFLKKEMSSKYASAHGTPEDQSKDHPDAIANVVINEEEEETGYYEEETDDYEEERVEEVYPNMGNETLLSGDEIFLHPEDERDLIDEELPFKRHKFDRGVRRLYRSETEIVSPREFLHVVLYEKKYLERYIRLMNNDPQLEIEYWNSIVPGTKIKNVEYYMGSLMSSITNFVDDLARQNLVVFIQIFFRLPIIYSKWELSSMCYHLVPLDNVSIIRSLESKGLKRDLYTMKRDIINNEAGNIAEYLVVTGVLSADEIYRQYITSIEHAEPIATRRFLSVVYHIIQFTTPYTNVMHDNEGVSLSPFNIIGDFIDDERREDEVRYDPLLTKLIEFLLQKHGAPSSKITTCEGFRGLILKKNYEQLVILLATSIFDLSKTEGLLQVAVEAPKEIVTLLRQHGSSNIIQATSSMQDV